MKKLDFYDMKYMFSIPMPFFLRQNDVMYNFFIDVLYDNSGKKPFAIYYFVDMMNTKENCLNPLERKLKNEK